MNSKYTYSNIKRHLVAIKSIIARDEFIKSQISDIQTRLQDIEDNISELKSISMRIVHKNNISSSINGTMADKPALDLFYKKFEDRFRGTDEEITNRLEEYIPYFQNLSKSLLNYPIVDLGCGRGEFLRLLGGQFFNVIGVDMNEEMVNNSKSNGIKAIRSDALTYLSEAKTSSHAAITGFHIVEHIPFEILMSIFSECYRVVKKDGFVLFETPNPQNILVGACNFYMDPSHIRPLPPDLLVFALEYCGFKSLKVLPLHPVKSTFDHADETSDYIGKMFYGPRDYAVIGYK